MINLKRSRLQRARLKLLKERHKNVPNFRRKGKQFMADYIYRYYKSDILGMTSTQFSKEINKSELEEFCIELYVANHS